MNHCFNSPYYSNFEKKSSQEFWNSNFFRKFVFQFSGNPGSRGDLNRWVPNPSKKTRGLGIGWSGTVSAGSAPLYTNGVVVGITLPETNSSHLKMDGWNTILSFFSGKNKGMYNLRFYLRTEPWDFHVFLNFCFHLRLYRFASSLAQNISVGI